MKTKRLLFSYIWHNCVPVVCWDVLLRYIDMDLMLLKFQYGQVYDVLAKLLVEQKLLTLPKDMSSFPVFIRVPVSLSFMCRFCRSLFVLFCVFFWPLCCLFFFDLRILITCTPLVSASSSYMSIYIYPNVCNEKFRQWQSTVHQPKNEQLYAITYPKGKLIENYSMPRHNNMTRINWLTS